MALAALCAALLLVLLPRAAAAQDAGLDVIRGTVLGPDSLPVREAQVSVTSLVAQTTRTGRTDAQGRFTILFANGGGDYLVRVASLGLRPFETRLQRVADEAVLLVSARMVAAPQVLTTVTVQGGAGLAPGVGQPGVGGAEQVVGTAASAALAPGEAGRLSALAATLPGVTLVPGLDGGPAGFSVLGLGADQNRVTLDGMTFDGAALPRGAGVSTVLATSTFDVSRGGFSGAELQLVSVPASNFVRRSLEISLDDPSLQWSDPAASRFGSEERDVQVSASFAGPIVPDRAFYNVSAQVGRESSDLASLLAADRVTLGRLGVAPDSMARFLDVLGALGVPATVSAVPGTQHEDGARLFGRVDFAPSGRRNMNVSGSASWNRNAGVGLEPSALPARGGETSRWNASLRGSYSTYFDVPFVDAGLLNETRLGANASGSDGAPYLSLPTGRVLVSSQLADGATAVSTLGFGGNGSLDRWSRDASVQLTNETSWITSDSRHRFRLTTELEHVRGRTEQSANQLGTFTYESLEDLAAGRPASFSRRLDVQRRDASVTNLVIALGDAWRPSERHRSLQVQYGLRLEANRFGAVPAYNPRVEGLFGLRTSEVPNTVHVSPRIGFTWSYGRATRLAGALNEGPRGTLSGGIGEFRNGLSSGLLASAIDNTGLPSGAQLVSCVGPAVPTTDWSAYLADPSALPTECADGTAGSVFADRTPRVVLFDPGFDAQRSVRANLAWSGRVLQRLQLRAEVVRSLNLSQGGDVDRNFAGVPRFALDAEGGRPVFVSPSSIVPATGAIATEDARLHPEFSRVLERRSDLRSASTRLQLSLSPVTRSSTFNWGVSWVMSWNRAQERGFDGTTAGDPRVAEWADGGGARHQLTLNLNRTFADAVSVTAFTNVRSGSRFTPRTSGDVNGDGLSNDRPFVFDPATTDDPALAAAMRALLEDGPENVRACLRAQLGRIAARNSCTGPWTASLGLRVGVQPGSFGLPPRTSLAFTVGNPLPLVDELLHGDLGLRGWGQGANGDRTLLHARGFDPATNRFRYEVNPRFGDTRPRASAGRQPFRISVEATIGFGPTPERQQLAAELDLGRRADGERLTAEQFRTRYIRAAAGPLPAIVQSADSLRLSPAQRDSIAKLAERHAAVMDSIYTPLATWLASLGERYDLDAAMDRVEEARDRATDRIVRTAREARAILTDAQFRQLPTFVQLQFDEDFVRRARRMGEAAQGGRGGRGR